MKTFLYSIIIYGYFILPVIVSVLGKNEEYDPDADGPMVIYFRLLSFVIALIYLMKGILYKKGKNYVWGLFIPFFFSVDFVLEYTFLPGSFHARALTTYLIFMIYSIPGIWVGIDMANEKNSIINMFKYILIYTIIITIVNAFAIPRKLIEGLFIMGDSNYQEFSYSCAVCYCVCLYYLLFKPDFVYNIFKSRFFKLFICLLLPVQVICAFMSGGRGGVVLLIVSSIVMIVLKSRMMGISYHSIIIRVLVFFVFVFVLISVSLLIYPDMIDLYNFDRIFSYISSSGSLDMSETSSRDYIYKLAIQYILDSPIVGYGTFRTPGVFGRPHNVFIEILLDGGLLLFVVYFLIFSHVFLKMRKVFIYDHNYYCMVPLILYPLVMLQFSGVYLFEQLFWFVLSYIISYKLNKKTKCVCSF